MRTVVLFASAVRGMLNRNVRSPPPKQSPAGMPDVSMIAVTLTVVPPRLVRVTRARTSSLQLIDAFACGEVTLAERSARVVGAGGSVTGGGVAEGCGGVVTRDPLPHSGNGRGRRAATP